MGRDPAVVLVYMGFRAHVHEGSVAPVWNDFDCQWYPEMDGGLSFPFICLTVEEKLKPGKLTRLGIEPGPAKWEATMLLLDHSDGPRSSVLGGRQGVFNKMFITKLWNETPLDWSVVMWSQSTDSWRKSILPACHTNRFVTSRVR